MLLDLGCNYLQLPLSVTWAGSNELGRSRMNADDIIDLGDLALLADHWDDSNCPAPDYCGGADLNPHVHSGHDRPADPET